MNDHVADTLPALTGFEQRSRTSPTRRTSPSPDGGRRRGVPRYPLGSARESLATLTLTRRPLFRELVLAWRTDSRSSPDRRASPPTRRRRPVGVPCGIRMPTENHVDDPLTPSI